MARFFDCPYLGAQVELTDEREAHIRRLHPEVLTPARNLLADTMAEPDSVRRDYDDPDRTRHFSRWYDDLRGGRHLVVVVVTDEVPARRHWIVTVYASVEFEERDILWERS